MNRIMNELYTFEDKTSDEVLLINGFQHINQLIPYINDLQKQNTELKEKLLKLEDKYIHNIPCCNEEDCELYKNYQQLEDNWNKLKEYCKNNYYGTTTIGILSKMQEIEGGMNE